MIANTTTTKFALTREDIQALRKADEVHARRYPKLDTSDADSASQLEARKRPSCGGRGVFNRHEGGERNIRTRERLHSYDRKTVDVPWDVDGTGGPYAFAYSISLANSDVWDTITKLLRVGDEIELEWIAGNSNGWMKVASGRTEGFQGSTGTYFERLYRDELKLHIRRASKGSSRTERKYSFNLSTQISPNFSCRMIRQGGGCF